MADQRTERSSDLENDVILPEQWNAPPQPLGGEIALLWMVLMDGIRTYQDAVERGATYGADFRETERWILSRSEAHVTSFRSLCEIFRIDPTRLRRKLLAIRDDFARRDRLQAG
jgi:hypothetical protein